ncbi:unnamed protein product [Rhizopus stolonifer]
METENTHDLTQSKTNNVDLITPPVSPVNRSLSSGRSIRIKAGQTGLPWLTKDAEGSRSQPAESPPPKFSAQPKFGSLVRLPTRKRTNQKYVYRMKDGISPVKILYRRLKSWQLSVKYLMNLFKKIKKVEIKNGKSYRIIDTNFAIPSKIQDQFKSSNGVQDAWAAFRQFTRENSLIHQDFVEFIENEIIPTLNIMLTDIHHFMQSLINNKNLHTDSLYNYRKKADKIITKFNKEIYKAATDYEDTIRSGKGPYFIPKKDPLLTKFVVANAIVELHGHENKLHKDFLAAQDEYRQFEQEKVVDVYTQLFQTFEAYRTEHGLERSEGVSKIVSIFNAIEKDSEWQEFLHHHQNELVKSTAAFKDEDALDFPNASHPLVQPLLMGDMKRKAGSSKWHNEYYVLSPVGILYCFKSEKEFHHRPHQPIFRSFVPTSSTQVNSTNQLLEFKGKALGFLGRKKHLELTTTHPQEIEKWASVMGSITSNQFTVGNDRINQPENETQANIRATDTVSLFEEKTNDEPQSQSSLSEAKGKEPAKDEVKDEAEEEKPVIEEVKDEVKDEPKAVNERDFTDDSQNFEKKSKEPVTVENDAPKVRRKESDVFYDTIA